MSGTTEAWEVRALAAASTEIESVPQETAQSPANERRMAEADGNRTRRERVAALPIGFEVRAGHQLRERFRFGV